MTGGMAMRWGRGSTTEWVRARQRGALRSIGAAVAALSLGGCWWTQPDAGFAHQRWNPFERELTAETVASAQARWSVTLPFSWDMLEPITDGESVYANVEYNSSDAVHAFDIETGEQRWTRVLPNTGTFFSVRTAPLTFSGDELVVPSKVLLPGNPQCAARFTLDPETGAYTGAEATEFVTSELVTAGPIRAWMTSGRCLGPPALGWLNVVDDRSGATWSAELGDEVYAAPTVSLVDELVYVNDRGTVRAFALGGCGAPTCPPLWSVPVPGFVGPVVLAGGQVLAFENVTDVAPAPPAPGHHHGALVALDARTGAETWRATYGGPTAETSGRVYGMAASDDTLYVTGTRDYLADTPHDGVVEAYPIEGCGAPECTPAWSAPLDVVVPSAAAYPSEFAHLRPVVAADVVYALDARGILVVGADGSELAVLPLDSPPVRMSVSAGHVFAVTDRDGAGARIATLTAFGVP